VRPGSAAIDSVTISNLRNSHDHDGTARPQGLRLDIGAFEYIRRQRRRLGSADSAGACRMTAVLSPASWLTHPV
jgi:hypothetical protein